MSSHGYDPSIAREIVLSLAGEEFVESLAPVRQGGLWADVYRCDFENEEIEGLFYVKFVMSEEQLVVTLLSCKEWGYGW
ncbi:DNA-binding HTH domain-containing protein [Eggerthella sp. YY7918]|nr:DNA-binding HTH domain-containing protein [Eggerthella sp. YY7918]